MQHRTRLSAERAEQQRQQIALQEAWRGGERLALLERFIEVLAEAERCAYARPPEWDDTHAWYLTTRVIMARFRVADRLIRIQFPLLVHDAAHAHFLDLNRAEGEAVPTGTATGNHRG